MVRRFCTKRSKMVRLFCSKRPKTDRRFRTNFVLIGVHRLKIVVVIVVVPVVVVIIVVVVDGVDDVGHRVDGDEQEGEQ